MINFYRNLGVAVIALSPFITRSQDTSSAHTFVDAIEDNSYLIEEAYNQEHRVVQHISNGYINSISDTGFVYSFTQEWPIKSVKHQLSYTVPYTTVRGIESMSGFGDVMINYRYQLFYKEDWACVSPRLSIILPTGDEKKELGMNTVGLQINLPVSKRVSDHWVWHFNAGSTFYPNVEFTDSSLIQQNTNLVFYNIGGSVIWLAGSKFNIMLECLENFNSEIGVDGSIVSTNETILNPGFRFAIDIKELQIVPGFSLPISIVGDRYNVNGFAYLSFEHSF